MLKLKTVIALAVFLLILAAGAYYYYNKPHKNIYDTKADYVLTSESLFTEFETDEGKANEKYLNKIIEVKGRVEEISQPSENETNVVLKNPENMFGISCNFSGEKAEEAKNIAIGESITVKGLCTGMLMDVVLINCTLLEKK